MGKVKLSFIEEAEADNLTLQSDTDFRGGVLQIQSGDGVTSDGSVEITSGSDSTSRNV